MVKYKRITSLLINIWLILVVSIANTAMSELPEKPPQVKYVNDYAGIFSYNQSIDLERTLMAYADSTSTQIVVITVPDLEGMDVSDYAIKLGLKWGIGTEDKDNGVVFLVAPNERKMFIATGYGVEDKLTDVFLSRIRENHIIPYFKTDNYYKGVDEGVRKMIERLSGKYQNDKPQKHELDINDIIQMIIVLMIILYIFSRIARILNFGETYSGRRYRSGPFGRIGGGFGGGGFGGGGFGGGGSFGGGSFGGGGSGGGW